MVGSSRGLELLSDEGRAIHERHLAPAQVAEKLDAGAIDERDLEEIDVQGTADPQEAVARSAQLAHPRARHASRELERRGAVLKVEELDPQHGLGLEQGPC